VTNAQIVGLGVRLFSIWLALYLLATVPSMWSFVGRDFNDYAGAWVIVVVSIVLLTAVILLWMFPLTVARKLIPRTATDQATALPIDQVQSVGFCLMGLWLLANAIPNVFWWTVMVYQSSRPQSRFSLESGNYASMAYTIVELVIGVWLLFGAQGLLGVVRWARTAGTGDRLNH
jgi:hypothetical protein